MLSQAPRGKLGLGGTPSVPRPEIGVMLKPTREFDNPAQSCPQSCDQSPHNHHVSGPALIDLMIGFAAAYHSRSAAFQPALQA